MRAPGREPPTPKTVHKNGPQAWTRSPCKPPSTALALRRARTRSIYKRNNAPRYYHNRAIRGARNFAVPALTASKKFEPPATFRETSPSVLQAPCVNCSAELRRQPVGKRDYPLRRLATHAAFGRQRHSDYRNPP